MPVNVSRTSALPRRRPLTVDQLMTTSFPDEPYVIGDGLLPVGGLLFIGGPPKTYKSFAVLTAATQLATGENLFNSTVTHARNVDIRFAISRPYRVLMIEQELDFRDDKARLEPMLAVMTPEQRRDVGQN